jgi:hypothetical protein
MDAYSILRAEAKRKRDIAIAEAKAQYGAAIREIDRLGRKLNATGRRSRYTAKICGRSGFNRQYGVKLTITATADAVLRDMGPLHIAALVLEIQRQGCRPGDDPRHLAKCVKSAFRYHSERFRKDEVGRWMIAGGA